MKNKEIEYLLNEMKDTTQDYIGTNGCKYQDLLREEIDLLLSYIEQLEKENQQLKEKLNCKEYFSSTMPEGTEFVILTKNNYDKQQKDLVLENIQLKKQKDDVVEYIKTFKDDIRGLDEIVLLRMLGEIDE